jgi:hypothetical protein
LVDFVRRRVFMALDESRWRIGRWRDWQLRRFRRNEKTLTVLGPYAATGVEPRRVVRRDRATAYEFTDKSVRFATLHRREDGRFFDTSALDHGNRSDEHDEHHGGNPQELLRREMGAHQWNI